MRTHHSSTIYFPHPNFNKDTHKNKVLYLRGKQDNKLDYLQGIGPLSVTMDHIFSVKMYRAPSTLGYKNMEDFVLATHMHTYRNRGHIYNFHESVEGPLYILTGVAGNIRYNGMWVQHSLDKAVAPQPETDNYLTLEIDNNKLKVASFFPGGRIMDKSEIVK